MEDKWLIYKIVFPNGKHYIGLTKDLKSRISRHKSSANLKERKPVYHAINHFGWDNIEFHEIHTDIPTLEEANELEKKYIKEYESYIENKKGYNATLGGDGTSGAARSEEQVRDFIEASKERWKDPEYRSKMLKISKDGSRFTKEVRKKIGERVRKRIAKNGHSWTGRKHKETSKDKMKGPRPNAKYNLASYYRGVRVYCSELDVVFFSVKHCADHLSLTKSAVSGGLKRSHKLGKKYKTLSYYKEGI